MRMLVPATVGILGGMGPETGAEFARLFTRACAKWLRDSGAKVKDQHFPEHWLAQVPAPDRNDALLRGGISPLNSLSDSMEKMARLGVRAVAIACNTAHYWHGDLQRRHPQLKILNIVDETIKYLQCHRLEAVGLMATTATIQLGLYGDALAQAGIRCLTPSDDEQALVMRGIHEGVKAGNFALAKTLFDQVVQSFVARTHVTSILLACTEIPIAVSNIPRARPVQLIDPSAILAEALASFAYGETETS